MNGINLKELCKQIKKSGKSYLIWVLQDGMHYISNRHWAVKFNVLPREVLIALFSVFADQPKAGISFINTPMGLQISKIDDSKINIKDIFEQSLQNADEGVITNVVIDYDNVSMRIFKTSDYITRINNDYASMTEIKEGKSAGQQKPISFCNNDLIILPFRATSNDEDELIRSVLEI